MKETVIASGGDSYDWDASRDGFPDAWYTRNTLELSRSVQNPHTSVSGVVTIQGGNLFAAYYFADGAPVSCFTLNNRQPLAGQYNPDYPRGTCL